MTDKTYNGWTNYATWRINLEIFDGFELDLDAYVGETEFGPSDLASELQQIAEDTIFEGQRHDERGQTNLMADYARAFLDDVNWREIAQHMINDYIETAEEGEL
jgi:hypothetical protein